MAISDIGIAWGTRVINVPMSAMATVQVSPVTIMELDLNAFRLQLKNLEDDEDGMPFPNTHNHNTEVNVGGLTLARVIEIINGYTVTFEDGQYAVNLTGANSNVGDVVNVNQVSVRSFNSAGMISSPAIEYSSFDGGVTVDLDSSYSGTTYPVGTPRQPVNSFENALLIASYRGFTKFYVNGDITINAGNTFDGYTFIGESITKTTMTVDEDADTVGCEFHDATVTGTLDGECRIENCLVTNLNYINGIIEQCLLGAGPIMLGGSDEAVFVDCWSGVIGTGTPIINMGGSGQNLGVRNYNGGLKIINSTGAGNKTSLDLNAARVIFDSANVTAGEFVLRGVGTLEDENGVRIPTGTWNGCTIYNNLVNSENITNAVWDELQAGHLATGSFGEIIDTINDKTGLIPALL